MNKPHKHAELIKAWADGAEIEYLSMEGKWLRITDSPSWCEDFLYRIKPEQKPDVEVYACCTKNTIIGTREQYESDNLKLTFDGETGKLKSAEVINND